jgi:hypothetical protein
MLISCAGGMETTEEGGNTALIGVASIGETGGDVLTTVVSTAALLATSITTELSAT